MQDRSRNREEDQPAVPVPIRLRSLRGQLVRIPMMILLAGLAVAVGTVLLTAQSRIAAEITSAMQLGHELATRALHSVADSSSSMLAFERLAAELPRVRHIQFELVPADATLFRGGYLRMGGNPAGSRPWLARLLAPPPQERVFPITVSNEVIGELRLRSNSADEIAEIVGEVELFAGTLAVLCLMIVAGLVLAVRRSLRPLQLLADGFDRLEQADYRPIASIRLAELRRVGQQFNHLAHSLCRITADNHFLIDKLLSMQEQERQQLAAELHDEFGPVLFGIRAEAACILRAVPAADHQAAPAHSHARAIGELADGLQKLNSRLLDRLRPLVLEQMGLGEALRRLVVAWRSRHPDVTWSLQIAPNLDEPTEAVGLTLYRVVQEAVTNVIRHARASAIEISLERRTSDGRTDLQPASEVRALILSVTDDGAGLPDNLRYGFGLLGMTERVRQFGGALTIANARPNGVVLQARIPEPERAATIETTHAYIAD